MTVRRGPFPREPHLHPHLGWTLSFGGWALRSNSHFSPWAITYPVRLSVLVSKMGTITPVPQDCPENQRYMWEAPRPWLPPSGLEPAGEGWRIQTRPRGNHGPAPATAPDGLCAQNVGVAGWVGKDRAPGQGGERPSETEHSGLGFREGKPPLMEERAAKTSGGGGGGHSWAGA